MDESDFDHLDDDPRRGKVKKDRPTWLLILQEQVLHYVLREDDDFVFKQNIASTLNAVEAHVGSCLAALVREGILTPLQPVDPVKAMGNCKGPCKCHARLHVGSESCYWENGKWMVEGSPAYRTRLHAIKGFRRKAKWQKMAGTKATIAKWDGRAHHIIRGEAFHSACERLGLPVDPCASWTCPRCGKKKEWNRIECNNYNITPACNYKRPDGRHWPKPVKLKTCERCGAQLAPSTLHKLRHCNVVIVRSIMES